MDTLNLSELTDELAGQAASATSGRAARTIYGGHEHSLRQTVISLAAGRALDEHESPGQATLQVIRGEIQLTAGDVAWRGSGGDFVIIPARRHSVEALTAATFILTVSTAVSA